MQGDEVREVMLQEGESSLIFGQTQNNIGRRMQWHKLVRDPYK
jgi:hypothetical protein